MVHTKETDAPTGTALSLYIYIHAGNTLIYIKKKMSKYKQKKVVLEEKQGSGRVRKERERTLTWVLRADEMARQVKVLVSKPD